MAKMGRPKADNPKSHAINLRVTKDEYEKMQEYATKHDLTIAESARQGIIKLLEEDKKEA